MEQEYHEVPVRFQEILETVRTYAPGGDFDLLRKAYIFAAVAHRGQLRKTGLPYLSHPLAVAKILAELRMDVPTICSGLLHDAIEDTEVNLTTLENFFGSEIAALVDGITKVGRMNVQSKRQRQLESYQKMLVAMSQDIRILLIKLADRLHNMRTLYALPMDRQRSISRETLAIYAPLANRLGIMWMRTQLEDLSFQHVNPEIYRDIRERVELRVKEKSQSIRQVSQILKDEVQKAGIPCEISGRIKHYYSMYRKMVQQGIDLDQIFDLLAIRVIVPGVRQCYEILGIIHSLWAPVPGRFKDYIAKPKPNRYRSLHTTVVGPLGDSVEIQIRTEEMHREAEHGIAAHWMYKEEVGFKKKDEKQFQWLRNLLGTIQELGDPERLAETLTVDLFPEEVYVFTPKGEVKELLRGATPIDFAYRIHTEVGHHCTGAKVNGRLVPLRYELKNGDIVEIVTAKHQSPKKDWLDIVKTPEARSKIRSWLHQEEQTRSQSLGREILEKGLRKHGLHYHRLVQDGAFKPALKALCLRNMEALLRAIAYGRLSVSQVYEALPHERGEEETEKQEEQVLLEKDLERLVRKAERKSDTGIKVRGIPDVMIRFAKCCNPVLGEGILGFITRGRGVTIHSLSCPKARDGEPERLIEVQWDIDAHTLHRTKIRVVSTDRPGLLAAISKVISSSDVNISNAKVWTTEDKQGVAHFEVMVKDLTHLKDLMHSIEQVKGVLQVERVQK